MDPSTSPAQDVQNQKTSDQQINRAQQPSTATQPVQSPSQPRSQVSVGNIEAGAATIIQESSDVDAEEDEIKVAPQEMKSQAVSSGGVEDQDEVIEVQPSIP
ncbi:MAG TPA: hypothetical protein VNW29_07455, partial [Candidatus Sulfotelmatobacter sp.]|nr:hypothetical protein [Candidatus Sulfotelmatobacter sp.]